jgi:hypothetical protein
MDWLLEAREMRSKTDCCTPSSPRTVSRSSA